MTGRHSRERNDLAGFLLAEQWDPELPEERAVHAGVGWEAALPAQDRQPNQAGFVLTWTEYPPGDPAATGAPRRGMVLASAPDPKTVWVVPDEHRVGEGYAVVVGNVSADSAVYAVRHVAGPGDYRSTQAWQQPRSLPRAWLRTDVFTIPEGEEPIIRRYPRIHTQPDCPRPVLGGFTVERGEPAMQPDCYIYGHWWLHPCSTRPTLSGRPGRGRPVPLCKHCLQEGFPP